MDSEDEGPPSGLSLLVVGCLFAIAGWALHALDDHDKLPGWMIPTAFGLGGIIASIGIIALGVGMAMRRHEWLKQNKPI